MLFRSLLSASPPIPGVCSRTTRGTREAERSKRRRGPALPGVGEERNVPFSTTPGRHPWLGPLGILPTGTYVDATSTETHKHRTPPASSGHSGAGLTDRLIHRHRQRHPEGNAHTHTPALRDTETAPYGHTYREKRTHTNTHTPSGPQEAWTALALPAEAVVGRHSKQPPE